MSNWEMAAASQDLCTPGVHLPVALAAATTGLQIQSQLIDTLHAIDQFAAAAALDYVRSTNLKWYSTSSGSQVGHPGS